jgi:hypothetical protein
MVAPTRLPSSPGTTKMNARRQFITPDRWKAMMLVIRPSISCTRLVPLATLGGRPMNTNSGKVTAEPELERYLTRRIQNPRRKIR